VTLRKRIAAVASTAVALAVVAAALLLYMAVRSDLREQIDESLMQRADTLLGRDGEVTYLAKPDRSGTSGSHVLSLQRQRSQPQLGAQTSKGSSTFRERVPRTIAPARFGAASGYVQFLAPTGAIDVPGGQGSSPTISLNAQEKAIAASGVGRAFTDRTVRGVHLRVLTVGAARSPRERAGAIMIARPLTEADHELRNILLILIAGGIAGIVLAALYGALVARAALSPIARFTRRAETLAGSLDISKRLEVGGRDELSRLAASFNATLDELERSLEAQRQLVADASHELRTPIATLRANIQILGDAERLPLAEQESLRQDILDELDELTALVSDVVELARGETSQAEWGEVRMHELVEEVAERARRRGGHVFELDLVPTIVRGNAATIGRAVTNLFDNARKWSPEGAVIEVVLRAGELRVRDHGPGFQEADLLRVFERFYRADNARRMPGSGLGLAIVRQAADAHDGYALAENAPGGGACLRVSFGAPLRPVEQPEALAST
jgi:two-component system, OmpR family, sensor histidine kinase MprB